MPANSMLFIAVADRDERVVSAARVTLRAAAAAEWTELRFDARTEQWVSEPIVLGDYLVRVEADGYATQQFPLEVKGAKLHTRVMIGREGEPYYVEGGRRIYYAPEAQKEGTRAFGVEAIGGAPSFLSRFIEIVTSFDVSRAELDDWVRPFGLHVYYQDTNAPRIFVVESDDLPGSDFGALPERLMELPGVRSARSITAYPDELLAPVIPNDVDFSLQYHSFVTRIPEAWERLPITAIDPVCYGSADVIVAIHDGGIETSGSGTVIGHDEFRGEVTGGKLSGEPGLSKQKVLYTFDFAPADNILRAGNDSSVSHGTNVAGLITAPADGLGVAGVAPNTRLCSYIANQDATAVRMPHGLDFIAGFTPGWKRKDAGYDEHQTFPAAFSTGRNPIPGAHIINCSHTAKNLASTLETVLLRLSLFGRNRRGALLFASAGNLNQNCRLDGVWGENLNIMRVSASTLDLREEEVRMNFSSFSLPSDRIIDFCTPSCSSNVSSREHVPPRSFGVITTTAGASDLGGGVETRTGVIGALSPRDPSVKIVSTAMSSFHISDVVILRDKNNPAHSELHTIANKSGSDTIEFESPIGYAHASNAAELILLKNPGGYTALFNGTSAAAPQASGIAALILSVCPALTWLEVRDVMRSSAVPVNLRFRGSVYAGDPLRSRYRWQAPAGDFLVDDDGLLTITRRTQVTSGSLSKKARFLNVADATNIVKRRALLIGAETTLRSLHSQQATVLSVASVDGFKKNDLIFIGRNSATVLIGDCLKDDLTIWVQSEDGFEPDDVITIAPDGPNPENVQIKNIERMTTGSTVRPGHFFAAECGFTLYTKVKFNHSRYVTVVIAKSEREGPYPIVAIDSINKTLALPSGGTGLAAARPKGWVVRKKGTEIRAVLGVNDHEIEIDPLRFDHNQDESIGIGKIAAYSPAFGYGRLDAAAAVTAAIAYSHDDRDLMIRNFIGDDGATKRGLQEVHSPDIWVRSGTPDFTPKEPPEHQSPRITVDPPIHIGLGKNDLDSDGVCSSAVERTFDVKIIATGAADSFEWSVDGGPFSPSVTMTGAMQALSDGVSICFDSTTGHVLNDRWLIHARQLPDRYLHAQVRNRGKFPSFDVSHYPYNSIVNDVARLRILLCVTDGFPVCRFSSPNLTPGANDLDVTSKYTGNKPRALYSIEITAVSGAGDTFTWYRDGAPKPPAVTLTAGTLQQTLNDGVKVRFRSKSGHAVGDRWDLYARSGPDAFLNVDHYWEVDPGAAGAFDPASQRAGTRSMQKCGITLLPADDTTFDYVLWPEALRPPTNNPNRTFGKPLRIFALGEVVPHDGKLIGFTAKDNNNFSYRELCFSKFSFRKADRISPLEGQIDITPVEKITTPFYAHVRTTAGSFSAERVRVRVTAVGGAPCTFRHSDGSWSWDVVCDAVTLQAPKAARDKNGVEKAATGEQYDIVFEGSYTAGASLKGLKIEVEILSDFRDAVIASVVHEIKVIVAVPLPQLAPLAPEPEPVPVSHVFTDFASLTKQTAERAFGPVVDPADANSLTTRYRTTSLFQMPTDMPAYAVCTGSIALQRDPANNQTVNLILRARNQPILGFPPIRYFIYRGLKLDQFLKGPSGTDAALIAPASTSPLVAEAWFDFLDLNAGATVMPSSAFGYDPAQSATASIDDVFFRVGGSQLPQATGGQLLGHFLGAQDFGFEIVLENGASAPTIGDLCSKVHEIKTAGAATPFALRVRKEEVLSFLDPAAFYGLHMHKDGQILVPGAAPHHGVGVYTNVVDKFAKPNRLYIDIRSDNGSSLNFHGNYGSPNQVKLGDSTSSPVAVPYGNNGWPILIVDSAPLNTAEEIRRVEIEFPVADNEKPALYVRHGSAVKAFPAVTPNGAWTLGLDVSYPNDLASSGPRKGVAWVLRLDYGRRDVATRTVPIPSGVLKTEKYLDNVFGPIDRASHWSGPQGLKWLLTQEDRYVDADMPLGWRQMMACGMAEQGGATPRVLLYAIATAREPTLPPRPFIPIRAVPEGASDKATFFAEPRLFGMFNLELDKIDDGGEVQTLELRQGAPSGYATLSALLLGLSKSEFDILAALSTAGLNKEYGRTLRLDSRHKDTDSDGHTYIRYRVGVQGLKTADGSYATEFPASQIFVYSVDQQFFASAAFAAAEPVPAQYARNFEEEKGAREWPVRERVIDAVDPVASSITIRNVDWRPEVVPGQSLKIGQSKNGGHDGQYTVASVSLVGQDTVIVLNGAALKNDPPLGRAFTLPKKVEDRFIDFDQKTAIAPTMRSLVDAFVNGLPGKLDDPTLRSHVDTVATILDRARQLAFAERARAADYDRCLYWARLRMGVALKDHPLCRKSASLRRELVKRFERLTRGYDVVFPPAAAGARKVVITGFDPYGVYERLDRSNPSGAVALALHGETIQAAGNAANTAYVVSAVFPVRYRDFDAGIVEEFMNAILSGANQVHTIITISQNGPYRYFDIERFAGRNRGGGADNEFVSYPASKVGGTGYDEFYESNLPAEKMVPGPFNDPKTQRLFFDQSYASAGGVVEHPSDGGVNDNVPSPAVPIGDVTAGSGGAYLSNEIFYRTAKRRKNLGSSTLTGHLHLPAPQYALMRIEDIIDEVRQLIARGLQAP